MPDCRKEWLLAFVFGLSCTAVAVDLETGVAVIEKIPQEQHFEAVIEAVNRATVSAQTAGRIEEVLFDVDDYVERDAVLLRFRSAEQSARLQQAQANVEEAAARLREARSEQARIASIYARQLVAKAAMDKADAELRAAQARHESASARLAEAQEQLEHTVVRSPYAGIVVERHVEVGETANPGQPLMTGVSLEQLRAVAAVPQRYIETVRGLTQANVYTGDGPPIPSESITVSPYADPTAHSFRVRVTLAPGSHGLYPGMLVKAGFATGVSEQLLIPPQALVQRSEVAAVYVIDENGTLRFRQVRAGQPLPDGRVPIQSGLVAGEQVALDPIQAGRILKQQATGTVP
jgi:membrane fusion protein, multidrug efflux system